MAAESCAAAVNNAIAVLDAIPGFTGTVIEIDLALGALLATEIVAGPAAIVLAVAEANEIVSLIRLGVAQATAISVQAAAALNNAIACLLSFISGVQGGSNVAASVSAIPPVPTVTESAGLGVCATKSGNRGICCAAVTQLGLARASQGFSYTNCNGKTVCLACGTKASTSKKHPGATVFSVKRVSCGPSGCPALGQTITPPI